MFKYAVPILASLNTEETIKFYTKKLGFTFHSDWGGYLIFSRGGLELHFWTTDNPEYPKNTGCYINLTDVDRLYAEYEPLGIIHPEGKLKDMDWEMLQFSILDNNGNIIHFGEEISTKL